MGFSHEGGISRTLVFLAVHKPSWIALKTFSNIIVFLLIHVNFFFTHISELSCSSLKTDDPKVEERYHKILGQCWPEDGYFQMHNSQTFETLEYERREM